MDETLINEYILIHTMITSPSLDIFVSIIGAIRCGYFLGAALSLS